MRYLRWIPWGLLFTVFTVACALWHWTVAMAIWSEGLSQAGLVAAVASPVVCWAARRGAERLFPDLP